MREIYVVREDMDGRRNLNDCEIIAIRGTGGFLGTEIVTNGRCASRCTYQRRCRFK